MQDKVHTTVQQAFSHIAEPTEQKQYAPPPPDEEPENNAGEAANSDEEPEIIEPVDDEYIDAVTETAFAIIDMVQTTTFKLFAEKRKLKKVRKIDAANGEKRLEELLSRQTSHKGVEIVENLSGKDAALMSLHLRVESYMERLPFTEAQKNMMRPGLVMMVRKNAGSIPPEFMFYAGLATAIGGNVAELFQI